MKDAYVQTVKEIAPAAGVAMGTVSGGIWTFLSYMPPVLGCAATFCGMVLSILLAKKAYLDIEHGKALKKAQIDDIAYRRDHDLPLHRKTDKC